MIYISIPVHEKPEVIADQMHNFKKYFPEARVILHLSKCAEFSISELEFYLNSQGVDNAKVNPIQFQTKWGSIIQAHLENIRYIITLGDAEKIIFHSSNDMFVKKGIVEYIKDKKYLFQTRKCTADSLWWVARRSVKDENIWKYFQGSIYASQIEGSMYSMELLKSLIDEIDYQRLNLGAEIFYPQEEVIFSSFAYKKGIKADGFPYVYSEIHQFDRIFFYYIQKYKILFNSNLIITKFFKRVLEKFLKKYSNYRISVDIINDIIFDRPALSNTCYLNDGNSLTWKIYEVRCLFSVKRVERELSNLIREFIRRLRV
ncbi:hypothetical protein EDC45_0960 [Mesocricetibacter intestinalis]|uniref:Core-2/I-Branching enzyme n=1 Tax=Mesocricetibacter intestinalis TaxID=1521930 RepID=A0A4R6VHQ7_9PAST|nr:hypothetical protein [Mesocricetibacter intestinalis]TDQ57894.1 hypothetical protein EDC45_0960 [Mesocricetibacter intestinalis]